MWLVREYTAWQFDWIICFIGSRWEQGIINLIDGETIDSENKKQTVCVFLPVLQSTPATVGVARSQTVAAAPPLVTIRHFHPEHLHMTAHTHEQHG